jgi:hypothetical protein
MLLSEVTTSSFTPDQLATIHWPRCNARCRDGFHYFPGWVQGREVPDGVRAVLVTDNLLDAMAAQAPGNVTWEWGEPDEYGFYTPTFTKHEETP